MRKPFDYSVKLPDNATPRQKELAKEIEDERKRKSVLINDVRACKRRLAYKLAEKDAAAKLAVTSKKSTKNIGFLRRKKERLEFRISTEAFTLEAEKELIRKKQEIDAELDEAIKSYRTRRKSEFIEGDILDLNKKIEEASKALDEIEKKLDTLYGELRKLNGETRKHSTGGPGDRGGHVPKKQFQEPRNIEVSLADIATIKSSKSDREKKESSE